MKSNRAIVCFTNSYPYGNRETYFETELKYLSKGFDSVIIVPKYNPYKTNIKRNIPENVTVWPPVVPTNKITRFFAGLFNFSPLGLYIEDFFKEKVYLSLRHILIWGRSLIMFRTLYDKVKPLLKALDSETVLYSYWAEAPIFVTEVTRKFKKAVRMHRGDFYINEYGGYLPLRQKIYDSAQLLVPISQEIATILKKVYRIAPSNILINYLGVLSMQTEAECEKRDVDQILRIVSCSRVDSIKRVDLIARGVMLVDHSRRVEWHHFGDGTEFVKIKSIAEQASNNVNVYLHGWTEQKDIIDFYRKNYVSWFVNVSKHEGVPVSIMEAMSFGIPVIATDAGATRELVDESNGFLVKVNVDIEEIANLLMQDKDRKYIVKRENAYLTWKNQFNADTNFTALVNKLNELNHR